MLLAISLASGVLPHSDKASIEKLGQMLALLLNQRHAMSPRSLEDSWFNLDRD